MRINNWQSSFNGEHTVKNVFKLNQNGATGI